MKQLIPSYFFKNLLRSLVLLVLVVQAAIAQVNRSNTKTSVLYRNHHQRIATGSSSLNTYEIRKGELWTWGENLASSAGNGLSGNITNPVRVGTGSNWMQVATSRFHTLALQTNGSLWSWGQNDSGQIGNNLSGGQFVAAPIQIGSSDRWTSIAVGEKHSVALRCDGTLWTWGANGNGQLGQGSTSRFIQPTQVGTDNKWVAIAAGRLHTIALKSDGTLWACGLNSDGQLGVGSTTQQTSFVQVGTDDSWTKISAGAAHTIAIKANGTLWAWGDNFGGQLGDGSSVDKSAPVQIGTDNNWASLSAGGSLSAALKTTGAFLLWGRTETSLGNQAVPVQIGTDYNWISIHCGLDYTIAMKANGSVFACGSNFNGQLGNGQSGLGAANLNPTQILSDYTTWIAVSAGTLFSSGLKSNGTIWGWGINEYGQAGDGTYNRRTNPVREAWGYTDWISVASGSYTSFGIRANGTLWAWGESTVLGSGSASPSNNPLPTQIGSDNRWVSIIAAGLSAYALKSDGTLWAWGVNGNGQLGNGASSSTPVYTPTQIGTDTKWTSISSGIGRCVMALKSDGTLWTWGHNIYGQLGDGTTTDKLSPIQIGSDKDWVSIAMGNLSAAAIKSNGTLWTWGYNGSGELGIGTSTVGRQTPAQMGTENNWISVSVKESHIVAVKSNGTLWAWGWNSNGQLGNGTNNTVLSPVQIGSDNTWMQATSGDRHTLGLKIDATLFCAAGNNLHGALGKGDTLNSNTFVCSNNCDYFSGPTAPAVNVCSGSPAVLSATGLGTISWYTAPTGGTPLAVGSTYTTPTLTSNAVYYAQDSTCRLANSRTAVAVTVIPRITAGFTINDTSQCLVGNSFVFTDTTTSSLGAITRRWNLGDTSTSAAQIAIKSFTSINSYQIKLTVTANNGCKDSITKTVGILPNPSVGFTVNQSAQCRKGNSFIFTDTSTITSGSIVSRVWDHGDTTSAITSISTKVYAHAINYQVKLVSVSDQGCSDSVTKQVTILPNPIITTTPAAGNFNVCLGAGNVITAAPTGVGITYQWFIQGQLMSTTNTVGVGSNTARTGACTVVVTAANGCRDTSGIVQVIGTRPINQGPSNPPPNQVVVAGNSADSIVFPIAVTGGIPPYTYTWYRSTTSSSSGFTLAPGVNNLSSYSPGTLSSTAWFYRTVSSAGPCGVSTSGTIEVTLVPLGNNFILPPSQSICSGVNLDTLTASTPLGGNGVFSYKWISSTTSATSGYSDAAGINNTIHYLPQPLSRHTWFRRIVNSNGFADTSSVVLFTVKGSPLASVTANGPTNICPGQTVTLSGSSTSALQSYQWMRNGNPIPGANAVDYVASTPGQYLLFVTDHAGCSSSTSSLITSAPSDNAFFNPYNDNRNGYIRVPSSPSINFSAGNTFTIESWVKIIEESSNPIVDNGDNGVFLAVGNGVLDLWNVNGFGRKLVYNTGIMMNQWMHIAVTYDNRKIKFYLNGSVIDSSTVTNSATGSTDSLSIGRQEIFSCACNMFDGSMDHLRIWNTARSASQISSGLNTAIASAPGLVASYGFDEGSGNVFYDASGNNNHGFGYNNLLREYPSGIVKGSVYASGSSTNSIQLNSLLNIGFVVNNDVQQLASNQFILTDTTANPTARLWTFGSTDTSSLISPTRSFGAVGIYPVKLRVQNASGCTDSVTRMLKVIPNVPTISSSALSFSNITSTRMQLTWTNGNGAARMVIARAGSPVNASPENGTNYTANSVFGSGSEIGTGNYVVYRGSSNTVVLSGLSPLIQYHFAIIEFNGDTSLSAYQSSIFTGQQTTLPVKWLSFTATYSEPHKALLSWSTAGEINNAYFEVERSESPKIQESWKSIGKVTGNGTTNRISNYTFEDDLELISRNTPLYYRIKQTDHDGKFEYSVVRLLDRLSVMTKEELMIHPNPNEGMVIISGAKVGDYSILNNLGQVVKQLYLQGKGDQVIQLHDLTSGIYYLIAQDGIGERHKILVK